MKTLRQALVDQSNSAAQHIEVEAYQRVFNRGYSDESVGHSCLEEVGVVGCWVMGGYGVGMGWGSAGYGVGCVEYRLRRTTMKV